jgi:hypothetical protein
VTTQSLPRVPEINHPAGDVVLRLHDVVQMLFLHEVPGEVPGGDTLVLPDKPPDEISRPPLSPQPRGMAPVPIPEWVTPSEKNTRRSPGWATKVQ